MLDFFRDSPAYEWMTREGLERGREEAREEARQREQTLLEASRQTIITLITRRYPKWTKLAKKQMQDAKNVQVLVEAALSLALAQDAEEVGNILANLSED